MSGSLRDKLMAAADESESKRQQPYDGVCGVLPFASWPVNFHQDFEITRDKLLRDGYTTEQLQTYIADVIETTKAALNNPDNPPNCNPVCPFDIYGDVGILAHFWTAVQLGEEKGLAFLTDANHAGQVIHGKKFPGRKQGSYAPWKKWIERKLKKDNALKPAALWDQFKAKPLGRWRAVESARIGQYLESPTGSGDDVTYKRFQDAVSEVRRDLKKG
jgi:hypothetical protein